MKIGIYPAVRLNWRSNAISRNVQSPLGERVSHERYALVVLKRPSSPIHGRFAHMSVLWA